MRILLGALLSLVFSSSSWASISLSRLNVEIQKIPMKEEAIIALRTPIFLQNIEDLEALTDYREILDLLAGDELSVVLSSPKNLYYLSLIEWKTSNPARMRNLFSRLRNISLVEWVRPNTRYEGDARELVTPRDPLYVKQLHHKIIQSEYAWMFNSGLQQIVVAVTDDGVDIDHEDLQSNIWRNQNEIPNNGIDDDYNGYVDDVTGWDFSAEDNDPRPEYSFWDGGIASHGTHVAGIVAAAGNNSVGLLGVAPNVKIMPLRFAGSSAWTSSVVAKAYAYAADNGARIITTSYNIDHMVGDPIFEEAVAYAYANQVLHFNSAGNSSQQNPKRQAMEELVLVCSTEVRDQLRDKKSGFSNWGDGVDICAPGSNILSTMPKNKYAEMSGTSMAAPNAAGVAALIWSLHPTWTRDQVLAQLYYGAENIDQLNETYVEGLGAGRINSFRALAFRPDAPRITRAEIFIENDQAIGIELSLAGIFRSDSVANMKNWVLVSDAEGGKAQIKLYLDRDYKIGSNRIMLRFAEDLVPGAYHFVGRSAGLVDPFNRHLDGDGDGNAGGDFTMDFEILSLEPLPLNFETAHANSSP